MIASGVLIGAALAVGLALAAHQWPALAFLTLETRAWMIACGSPLAAGALGVLLATVPRRPQAGRLALISLILALIAALLYVIMNSASNF